MIVWVYGEQIIFKRNQDVIQMGWVPFHFSNTSVFECISINLRFKKLLTRIIFM